MHSKTPDQKNKTLNRVLVHVHGGDDKAIRPVEGGLDTRVSCPPSIYRTVVHVYSPVHVDDEDVGTCHGPPLIGT